MKEMPVLSSPQKCVTKFDGSGAQEQGFNLLGLVFVHHSFDHVYRLFQDDGARSSVRFWK